MESQQMQFGSVTFVLVEAILRELSAKVTHHPVARDLGDHACGGDAQADAIAVNDRCLRNWKRDDGQAIDQDVVRRLEQSLGREAHCTVACTQDIDSIDLHRIDNADRPSDLLIRDQLAIDFLA
jgi:hypothetical protein